MPLRNTVKKLVKMEAKLAELDSQIMQIMQINKEAEHEEQEGHDKARHNVEKQHEEEPPWPRRNRRRRRLHEKSETLQHVLQGMRQRPRHWCLQGSPLVLGFGLGIWDGYSGIVGGRHGE